MEKSLRRILFISVPCTVLVIVILIAQVRINERNSIMDGLTQETIAQVRNYADDNNISMSAYPAELCALLEAREEAKDFVLSYPKEKNVKHEVDLSEYAYCREVPLFMQFDKRWGYIKYGSNVAGLTGCGPVCLSMVAYWFYRSNDVSPDKIIEFAKDNGYCTKGSGSSWTLISKGAQEIGLCVDELPLDENIMVTSLKKGKKIILVMGAGDFTSSGHYIVVTGYDGEAFTVNDPYSIENSSVTWTYERIKGQIRNIWALWKED